MPADEKAAIRPIVAEVLEAGKNWCATFCDERDGSVWVQVSGELINFGYAGEADPLNLLIASAAPDLGFIELQSWSHGKFATFRIPGLSVGDATSIVDSVFSRLLGREEGFPIGVQITKLQ